MRVRLGIVAVVLGSSLLPAVAARAARADGPPPPETVLVPANDPAGVTTATPLEAWATYRLTVTGTFTYGSFGSARYPMDSDAECTRAPVETLAHPGGPVPRPLAPAEDAAASWQRDRFALLYATYPSYLAGSDLWDPDPTDDATDLYVDDRNIEWIPTVPTARGCAGDPDHTYVAYYSPVETHPLRLRVFDIEYRDNSKTSLTVVIEQVAPPSPVRVSGRHIETLLLHSRSPDGVTTRQPLIRGHDYSVVAHGMYNHHITTDYPATGLGNMADAACVRTDLDPVYRRRPAPGSYAVAVRDGDALLPIPWRAVGPGVDGCNQGAHFYVTTDAGAGVPVTFVIDDADLTDNSGTLSLDVYQLD